MLAAFLGIRVGPGDQDEVRRPLRAGDEPFPARHAPGVAVLFGAGAERDGFENLKSKVRMIRYGGDCYAYALLASGFVDVIVECGLKPYDIVALIPIIEAAGGRVTDWNGGPAASGGRILACGDRQLHGEILKVLAG